MAIILKITWNKHFNELQSAIEKSDIQKFTMIK